MEMNLVIQQQRKRLGLTQEQLADCLGVTTSAVNKWERGSTCPDIGLLAPLARLLEIDLNTLFSFREDLSPQEITLLCKELHTCILEEGFDAGFAQAQGKIREYPNNDRLLYTLAMQLQTELFTAGLDAQQKEKYMRIIRQWYEQLSSSSDPKIRNSILFMLASRAIGEKQYEQAQKYLDELPNRSDIPDKRMLQAAVYLYQDQMDEALKLLESTLLSTVGDVQMILYRLVDASLTAGKQETAAYAAECASRFAETFDLNPYSAALAPFQLYVARRDPENAMVQLKKLFDALSHPWKFQESPLYSHIPAGASTSEATRLTNVLLQELKQNPEYAFLHKIPEFQQLLREFES